MKKVALTLIMSAGLAGLSANALAAATSTAPMGDAEAGKQKSVTCAACHGNDGNSMLAENPKLAGQHEGYLAKQLTEFRLAMQTGGSQGRMNAIMGGMAVVLSDQDILDLSAYYASQQMVPGTTSEESIELGQKLYRAGDAERGIPACIACHGPRGNGTSLSGFPKISFQHAQYTKTQLEMFRDGQRNNDMNAMMRGAAANLKDADIAALSEYLGGLH